MGNAKQIFTPKHDRPMHVVVFGSGPGVNLLGLLQAEKEMKALFSIRALLVDKPCGFEEIGKAAGLPVILNSFKEFFSKRGVDDITDEKTRVAYDLESVKRLQELNFSIDLIFLANYMRVIYSPLLNAFPNAIINVHPSDLTVKDTQGERKYKGAHAVYDALKAGEIKTRSSVFLVDSHLDTGPLLVSGPFVDYTEGVPVTKEKAKLHQEKQKIQSDLPAVKKALSLIAQGKLLVDENRGIWLENEKLGESGIICS
ncbi:MAG: formyltransferase family protein [Waddliaceae bacterium]